MRIALHQLSFITILKIHSLNQEDPAMNVNQIEHLSSETLQLQIFDERGINLLDISCVLSQGCIGRDQFEGRATVF